MIHPNFQSLLFSQYHPFTEIDYTIIYTIANNNSDSDDEFKQLLSQLLITASFGIQKDGIFYLQTENHIFILMNNYHQNWIYPQIKIIYLIEHHESIPPLSTQLLINTSWKQFKLLNH